MTEQVKRTKDFYNLKPNAEFIQEEFGFLSLNRWKKEGYINDKTNIDELFGFTYAAKYHFQDLGWCESAFCPEFEVKVLEDRGDHELVQDRSGRSVLCFKGRRNGFMPEYVDHPVKDLESWKALEWRLDETTPERYANKEVIWQQAKEHEAIGFHITQQAVGGYMYLRSLMGPEQLLYMFYDDPDLIHACMKKWFELNDYVISKNQEHVSIDELFLAEDICYKSGPLISPDMIREFLFPYYQQLFENIKKRQLDKSRKVFFQLDTDGNCLPVIDLYKEVGVNYMSPFEVASDCDVVEVRKKYPDLLIRGGFDKRILAKSKDEIDREIDRIMPFMKEHGGYIPTCDHDVPEEVSFENYMHFRNRLKEF